MTAQMLFDSMLVILMALVCAIQTLRRSVHASGCDLHVVEIPAGIRYAAAAAW
jgi:hypothetical protein